MRKRNSPGQHLKKGWAPQNAPNAFKSSRPARSFGWLVLPQMTCILKYSNIFVNFSVSCINSLTADPASFTPFYWKAYTLELSEPQLKEQKKCARDFIQLQQQYAWGYTPFCGLCVALSTIDLIPSRFSDLFNFNDAFRYHLLRLQLLGFPKPTKLLPVIHLLSE